MDIHKHKMNTNFRELLHASPALFLFVGAALKGHQIATLPFTEHLIFQSKLLSLVLVALEMGIAAWLLSGFKAKIAKKIAITLFSIFAFYLMTKLSAGAESCGCFGAIDVPPVFSLIIDLLMIGLLVLWKPRKNSPLYLSPFFVVAPIFAVIFVSTITLKTHDISETERIDASSLILIECEDWVGKNLSIASHIEDGGCLLRGHWVVVFYHESCPKCQELLSDPTQIIESENISIAFVELPPSKGVLHSGGKNVIWRSLSEKYDWFASTPTGVEVEDGLVVRVIDFHQP